MTIAIKKTALKVIFATYNLAIVPGLAIVILAFDNSAPPLKIINTLLLLNCILYIYHPV